MYIVIRWLIIFSLIAIWFAVGIKICSSNSNVKKTKLVNTRECKRIEHERTQQYITFIHSDAWRKIESLEPIPYSPEPNNFDYGREDCH